MMTKEKKCKTKVSNEKKCGSRRAKIAGLLMLSIIIGIIFMTSSCEDCNHTEATNKSDSLLTEIKKENKMSKQQLETNKEICLAVSRAISKGQWYKVEELLADDFTYIGDGAEPINKQQYIGFMKNVLCSAMTDMDMKFLRVIAEGDMVAVDYTNAMTNSGDFYGIPATQKRIFASGQFIREVKNGKVTAEWQTTNAMGMMAQLGVVPGN